jgi:YfiH family protein
MNETWLQPDWPAPVTVRSLLTTRYGGVSQGPYSSLNLGDHVGDTAHAVAENRARLLARLPAPPLWLKQVHGSAVLDASAPRNSAQAEEADAIVSRRAGEVCVVLTADCLPVLFCDRGGSVVAAAHAGWRGLLAGVLERTVMAMKTPPGQLLAYLGPAIGPQSFEVGDEVREGFVAANSEALAAFAPLLPNDDGGADHRRSRKWRANLYLLARQRLAGAGVEHIFGGNYCTVRDRERFFSYRRDGVTGRMAALIWLA